MKAITGLKAHPCAPCVISCSLDGTIRIWHLENLTECCRVDCGDGLLGMCNEFPSGNKLTTYSQHEIRMWEVNQLETHFTTVNSRVTHMFRVSCSEQSSTPPRIVALAEDDGVRLLSPVSGQILTILFPMFSGQMLENVVYLLCEERLFVLLRTGSILVVSTSTNPCSTLQLWTPSTRNTVYCITMVTVVLKDDDRLPVVFAGQYSGDISLVYAPHSRLSMPLPCPSHDGPVMKLIGSCDPIHISRDSHKSALVTYGQDNILNVWSMEVDKAAAITLKMLLTINLSPGPSLMCLLSSTLCLAIGSSLVMLDLTEQEELRTIPSVQSLTDIPLLTHQKEDDHGAPIISLTCSEELKLYATSSKDGLVKIWSASNQLVSEMEFDDSLAAVCFGNSRGDLLVGFQKHVCVMRAEDYLTSDYVAAIRGLPLNDREERPITFDPDLEFWYDSGRVPSLPMEQELRDQLLSSFEKTVPLSKVDTFSVQTVLSLRGESGLLDQDRQASAVQLQRLVNKSLAQGVSQQYSKIIQQEGRQSKVSIAIEPYTSYLQHSEIDSTHLLTTPTLSGSSGVSSLFTPSLCTLSSQDSQPLIRVTPLESPSDKLPIAPDGYIPNSVIRAQIGFIPPVVTFPVYRPPSVKHKLPLDTSTDSLSSHTSTPSHLLEEDGGSDGGELSLSEDEKNKQLVTCVSSFKTNHDNMLNWSFGDIPNYEFGTNEGMKRASYMTKKLPPLLTGSSAADAEKTEEHLPGSARGHSGASGTHNVDRKHGTQPKSPSNSGPSRQKTPATSTLNNKSDPAHRVSATSPSQGPLSSTSNGHQSSSASRGTLSSVLLSPPTDSTHKPQEGVGKRRRSSVTGKFHPLEHSDTDKGRRLSKGGAPELPAVNESDELGLLIQRICGVSWFPKSALRASGVLSVDQVFSVLIGLLKASQLPVFREVCRALLDLNKLEALSDDQQMTFALRLVERHSGTEKTVTTHLLRLEILKTLRELGVCCQEVLFAVLPILTDSNLEIRKAAFATLRSVAGIVRKSQLHQLLLDLGLLQHVEVDEDEVIEELAGRLKNGLVKQFSSSRFLPRATKTRFSTFPDVHSSTTPHFHPLHTAHTSQGYTHPSHQRPSMSLPAHRHSLDPTFDHTHHRRGTHPRAEILKKHPPVNQAHRKLATSGPASGSHDPRGHHGLTGSHVHTNRVRQLLMTPPHTLSQCPQAMRFMLGSKVKSRRYGSLVARYEWSEIHPVIEESLTTGFPDNSWANTRLVPIQNGTETEHATAEYGCMANLMTRRLLRRQLEHGSSERSVDSKKEEKRNLEQCLVISLPKLNTSTSCC